jgi:hypothetical protein
LNPADVATYLRRNAEDETFSAKWDPVFVEMEQNKALREALSTPLMVDLARTLYNPRAKESTMPPPDPSELCDRHRFPSREKIEERLLDAFLEASYRDITADRAPWTVAQSKRSLIFLAKHQDRNLQGSSDLAWWEITSAVPGIRRFIGFVLMAFGGCLFGYSIGTMLHQGGLLWPLVGAVTVSLPPTLLSVWLQRGQGSRPSPAASRIPTQSFRWSWRAAVRDGKGVAVACLILIPFFGLRTGLVCVFLLFALYGLDGTPANVKEAFTPRSVLRKDRLTGAVILVGATNVMLIANQSTAALFISFGIGIVTGLHRTVWGEYIMAKTYLAIRGDIPWRFIHFLEDAHERGLLRQVGGVYQFRHITLQKRLAAESEE